jgi:hypothetical protein
VAPLCRRFTGSITATIHTLAQVRAFVEGNEPVSFTLTDRTAAHLWMTQTLKRFR